MKIPFMSKKPLETREERLENLLWSRGNANLSPEIKSRISDELSRIANERAQRVLDEK